MSELELNIGNTYTLAEHEIYGEGELNAGVIADCGKSWIGIEINNGGIRTRGHLVNHKDIVALRDFLSKAIEEGVGDE